MLLPLLLFLEVLPLRVLSITVLLLPLLCGYLLWWCCSSATTAAVVVVFLPLAAAAASVLLLSSLERTGSALPLLPFLPSYILSRCHT